MSRYRPATVGLVLVAVVVAGCGAPVAESASETAGANGVAGSTANITVENGTLSTDINQTFARVQALRGTNVTPPNAVRVYNSADRFQNQSADIGIGGSREFWVLAGMKTTEVNLTESVTQQQNGYVTGLGSIVLYVGENASTVDEQLLVVHELTHYLQLQSGLQETLINQTGGRFTTESSYIQRALIEGGAVVTTDTYLRKYSDTDERNSDWYRTIQSKLPDGHVAEYGNGQYINGFEYMNNRTTSLSELAAVYENPPRTSEQLLHQLDPQAEPPTPLNVTVETGENWVPSGTNRMGEAFVRTALDSEVDSERAIEAAAGWGNDTLQILRPDDGGNASYAWVLDWDDAENRTEFVSAYSDNLDARATATDGVWELDNSTVSATILEPTETTAVVVFGTEPLVENVTASGAGRSVTVST